MHHNMLLGILIIFRIYNVYSAFNAFKMIVQVALYNNLLANGENHTFYEFYDWIFILLTIQTSILTNNQVSSFAAALY